MTRLPLLLLLCTAQVAAQSTWVVDDDPGPGVDFGEIQEALFASSDGDLILVGPGSYSGFVVRRAVRILGEGTPQVTGAGQVRGVQSFLPVVIEGLRIDAVEVVQCSATVALLDSTVDRTLDIAGCADLRAHGVTVLCSTEVESSRAEFVRCLLRGADGSPGGGSCDDGEDGLTAVFVRQSEVHFALTDLVGGDGGFGQGSGCLTTCNGYGGSGGNGLTALGSDVVLAGDGTQRVEAGSGGWSSCFTFDGRPGYAATVQNGELRYSGVNLVAPAGYQLFTWNTTITTPSPDPTVEVVGTPGPGAQIDVVVRGTAGDHARLQIARAPTIATIPGSAIDMLVTPGRALALGPLPANGQLALPLTIPTSYPVGTYLWLQASAVDASSGQGQSSNSAVILVR